MELTYPAYQNTGSRASKLAHQERVLATQARWPEFDPRAYGERREATSRMCPLTSPLWRSLPVEVSEDSPQHSCSHRAVCVAK